MFVQIRYLESVNSVAVPLACYKIGKTNWIVRNHGGKHIWRYMYDETRISKSKMKSLLMPKVHHDVKIRIITVSPKVQ